MGKVFIKTDVLGKPHWGVGEGQLHSDLPLCPSVSPHAAHQDKKAGEAHGVQLPSHKKLTLPSKMRKNALIFCLTFYLFLGPTPKTLIYGGIEHRQIFDTLFGTLRLHASCASSGPSSVLSPKFPTVPMHLRQLFGKA